VKLAAVWAQAIQAATPGIQTPTNTGAPDTGTASCPPSPDKFTTDIVQIQQGSGADDGTWIHSDTVMPKLVTTSMSIDEDAKFTAVHDKQMMFAQLVSNNANVARGGEADDLVLVLSKAQREYMVQGSGSNMGQMNIKINGHWDDDWLAVTPQHYCDPLWTRFGDFNNDGYDDFLCLEDNGDLVVSINQRTGKSPMFGPPAVVRPSTGIDRSMVRLGDIDGDGRLDYCYLDASQNLWCFRNGGTGDTPAYWQDFAGGGPTFDGKGWPEMTGIRLVDINGDFRADVVYVYGDAGTAVWINQRGVSNYDGPGLKPAWIAAKSSPGPYGVGRDAIKFARIYATGRADIVKLVTSHSSIPSSVFGGNWDIFSAVFTPYQNTGVGGTKLKGDGNHYCDMYGRGHGMSFTPPPPP
jgi:hypothetical protein